MLRPEGFKALVGLSLAYPGIDPPPVRPIAPPLRVVRRLVRGLPHRLRDRGRRRLDADLRVGCACAAEPATPWLRRFVSFVFFNCFFGAQSLLPFAQAICFIGYFFFS